MKQNGSQEGIATNPFFNGFLPIDDRLSHVNKKKKTSPMSTHKNIVSPFKLQADNSVDSKHFKNS